MRAEVELADGKKLRLQRYLRLEYPQGSGTEAPATESAVASAPRPPSVYLSYSTQDSRLAAELRAGLETAGLGVFDQTRLRAGEPWSEALERMMSQADAVVGIVGEGEVSSLVYAELQAAQASAKPTIALLPDGASSDGLPSSVRVLQSDRVGFDPVAAIAELVHSQKGD